MSLLHMLAEDYGHDFVPVWQTWDSVQGQLFAVERRPAVKTACRQRSTKNFPKDIVWYGLYDMYDNSCPEANLFWLRFCQEYPVL